jgi:hypothetical protein
MKKTVGIVGLLILVALGWIAWPYYAVYDFANAIQQGDQVALERRVAWDSVRGGLREDFNAVLARSTQGAGLAALVGPAIINNAIDSFVTPQGGPEPEERYFRSETLRNKGSGLTEPRAEWQPPVMLNGIRLRSTPR